MKRKGIGRKPITYVKKNLEMLIKFEKNKKMII